MTLLSLILFTISAALTCPIIFAKRGPGPEGAVGFHMITGPLALLQVAGVAILVHRGMWDFFPSARVVYDVSLVGYLVSMTILPVFALPREDRRRWAQAGTLAVLAAGMTAGVALAAGATPLALRIATGVVLSAPCLAGLGVLAAIAIAAQNNAIRVAEAAVEREQKFDVEQSAFDAGEWAKLPAEPALWQLITLVYSRNAEVQKACRERIAARPALTADMIELLGTGWGKYGADYIRDCWTPPAAPLAPAYAAFLESQLEYWQKTLAYDPNPGGWMGNLRPLFDAAEKIVRDGGDLRGALEKWRTLAGKTRGLEPLERQIAEIPGKRG